MTAKALAERAHVDRSRIAAIERGEEVRPSTLGAVEKALTALEEEMSGPYDDKGAESGTVTLRVKGNFGVEAEVQGPVENLTELEASIARLLAALEKDPTRRPPG